MPPETITSCYPETRLSEFQPNSGRHLVCCAALVGIVWRAPEPMRYVCFAIGAIVYLQRNLVLRLSKAPGLLLLVLGLIAGGKPFFDSPPGPFYGPPLRVLHRVHLDGYVYSIGATFVLLGVLAFAPAARLLSTSFGRFLGRISFGLYLVHFILLGSVLANLYVWLGHGSILGMAFSIAVYLAAVLVGAFAFTLLIDEPSQRLSSLIKRGRAAQVTALTARQAQEAV